MGNGAAEAHIIPFGGQVIRENPADRGSGRAGAQNLRIHLHEPSSDQLISGLLSAIYKALAVSTDSGSEPFMTVLLTYLQ